MITAAQIKKLFPSAKAALVAAVVDNWHVAEAAGIVTTERVSEFLANIGVETGGLTAVSESLNYSVDGLLNTFGRHRISEADARRLGRKKGEKTLPVARQREIANLIYGGSWGAKNLGNRPGTGDGWNYRGGGMMQTTGYANYAALGFVDNPDDLRNPVIAFNTAVREWSKRGCNARADVGDITGNRRAINGGTNGLAEVKAYVSKARTIFAGIGKAAPAVPQPPKRPEPAPEPVTVPAAPPAVASEPQTPPATPSTMPTPAQPERRVYTGVSEVERDVIKGVQSRLKALGYTEVGGVDGLPGKFTKAAVAAFRLDNNLTVNADIDDELILALDSAKPREIAAVRSEATPSVVTTKVPEANKHWWNKWLGWGTAGLAGGGGVIDAIAPARGAVDQVRDVAADVPGWVWLVLIAILALVIARIAQRGEANSVDAFRDGSRR